MTQEMNKDQDWETRQVHMFTEQAKGYLLNGNGNQK
jgi:hypothetical protein